MPVPNLSRILFVLHWVTDDFETQQVVLLLTIGFAGTGITAGNLMPPLAFGFHPVELACSH